MDDAATQKSKRELAAAKAMREANRAPSLFGSIAGSRILRKLNFKGHLSDNGTDLEAIRVDEMEEDNENTFTIFEEGEEDDDQEVRLFITEIKNL